MTGTVSDASGAVIPKAQVSIKNVATGEVRAVTTDAAGFYTAPNLLPGSYEVTVTAPGFSTEVRSGITLTVGAQQMLNITMQVGQVSQKVEVTGEAPVCAVGHVRHQWRCQPDHGRRASPERAGLDPTRDSPAWGDFGRVDTSEYR